MARFDISVMERIELRPEYVAFEGQGGEDGLLLVGAASIRFHVIKGEIRIARRLAQALVEISERLLGDEIVGRQHSAYPFGNDRGSEELGERRRDRLEQAALAYEVHIGLDREARGRKDTAVRGDIASLEPEAIGERQPPDDATIIVAFAVVIDDALAPDTPQLRIAHPRQDGSVFHRDHALIIVAIERPGLDLSAIELAGM